MYHRCIYECTCSSTLDRLFQNFKIAGDRTNGGKFIVSNANTCHPSNILRFLHCFLPVDHALLYLFDAAHLDCTYVVHQFIRPVSQHKVKKKKIKFHILFKPTPISRKNLFNGIYYGLYS